MSISENDDSTLFKWLTSSEKLLKILELKLSSSIVSDMIKQIKLEQPVIEESILRKKFLDLQDSIEVEFSKRGQYSEKIMLELQKSVRKTIRRNLTELQRTFEINHRLEKWEQRQKAFKMLEKFRKLILRGYEDEEDRLIGISYAYLGLVNGVYRFALQDCYAWERLKNSQSVNAIQLQKMEIHNIYRYYKDHNLPLIYFDGWDAIVRNAVGHGNFYYDNIKQKMTFVDEVDTSRKKISEYDFSQMVENYQKLIDVYLAVIIQHQVLLISSVCAEFLRRYSSCPDT